MLEEMPYDTLIEWRAFDQIFPVGELRGDWQAASITAGVSNMIAASVRSRQRFKVSDFLLAFRSPEEIEAGIAAAAKPAPPNWQNMKFIARMCAAQANADERLISERQKRRAEKNAARDEAKALAKARKEAAKNVLDVRAALLGGR